MPDEPEAAVAPTAILDRLFSPVTAVPAGAAPVASASGATPDLVPSAALVSAARLLGTTLPVPGFALPAEALVRPLPDEPDAAVTPTAILDRLFGEVSAVLHASAVPDEEALAGAQLLAEREQRPLDDLLDISIWSAGADGEGVE